ncbi:MAG TPA: SRPBCC domain-containing protein [Galbitalea sp.]|jgi:uncharacterized protein YndB with AHSA1/START domain|nr:SRPBCC domain-containing protein [Galbitalea sp.]
MNGFTITREIAATPERVWAAFTDAKQYAAWIWPTDWETMCSIDAREGGVFSVASLPKGMSVEGIYTEVNPYSRLAMSWQWHGEDGKSLVTMTFEPIETGTRLILRHENFPDEASSANHEQGWNDCLDRLPAHLA